jgi:hypothetical protein
VSSKLNSVRILASIIWALTLMGSFCFAIENQEIEYVTLSAIETVSDIASSERFRELYPGTQLYGEGGRLQLLLKLNPDLRSGVAAPGTKVILSRDLKNKSPRQNNLMFSRKVGLQETEIAAIKLKVLNVQTYVAQPGDTMSLIALRFFSGAQLYGSGGRLELLLKLNPHIENKNSIFPGDLILVDPYGELKKEIENRSIASDQQIEKHDLQTVVKKEVSQSGYSYLNLATGGSFYRVDSRDNLNNASGVLLSTLSPFVEISWEPQISSNMYFAMGIETSSSQWSNPVGRIIENHQENLSSVFFRYGRMGPYDSRVSLEVQQEEVLVPRAVTTDTIKLEKTNSTQVGAELLFNIMNSGPFNFDGTMSLGLSSGAKSGLLQVKQGYYYDFSLELSQMFKKYKIKSAIQYTQKSYDTDFSSNEMSRLQFLLGLGFKLED